MSWNRQKQEPENQWKVKIRNKLELKFSKSWLTLEQTMFLKLASESFKSWRLYFKISLKKLYGPFLWMWLNCLKATRPLQEDNLLLTTKSQGVPGTNFIDLGRMKSWDAPSGSEPGTAGMGNQHSNKLVGWHWIMHENVHFVLVSISKVFDIIMVGGMNFFKEKLKSK